jgi:hypothetical protein
MKMGTINSDHIAKGAKHPNLALMKFITIQHATQVPEYDS